MADALERTLAGPFADTVEYTLEGTVRGTSQGTIRRTFRRTLKRRRLETEDRGPGDPELNRRQGRQGTKGKVEMDK